MRKGILLAVLIGMLALPVLAQFPGGGFGRGMDGNTLLSNEDVQKDIKMTDDQKAAVKKARDAMQEAFRKAREDMDREAMTKATEEYTKALMAVRKDLKPEQTKRLLGIEVQAAEKNTSPRIFANADVQKALKLTDDQKKDIKELMTDMDNDLKELFKDKSNFQEAFTKLRTMSKETYGKITKKLTEEQKTALKELKGEEFKGNLTPGTGRFKGGKGKKKDDL